MSPSFFRIWFRCSCCDSCCWRWPGCTEGRERVCEVWYTFCCSGWNSQSGWYPSVCSQQLRMREASQNPCSSESKAFNLLLLNSSPGTKRITVKWSVLLLFWSCSSQPYALGFISCYLYLGDVLGERVRGCFPLYRTNRSETTRTNQGKMEPKLRPNWLLGIVVRARVTYCQEKNAGKHRQNTEKPVIYLSLKTDENQKKNKLRCTAVPEPCVQLCIRRKFRSCVWSLHTLHSGVNNYIWTIRHFDYCV